MRAVASFHGIGKVFQNFQAAEQEIFCFLAFWLCCFIVFPIAESSSQPGRFPLALFPNHRDLYLLVAGILLGVVLGPGVLGQLAPHRYARWFIGGQDAAMKLAADQAALNQQLDRLRSTGVSPAAAQDLIQRHLKQTKALRDELTQQRLARRQTFAQWRMALIIALIVVMGIEALTGPQPQRSAEASVDDDSTTRMTFTPTASRLITVRYAVLAVWIALALAQPTALRELPIGFTLALIGVALVVGLVPLGRRR